jgi:hypothetical protein
MPDPNVTPLYLATLTDMTRELRRRGVNFVLVARQPQDDMPDAIGGPGLIVVPNMPAALAIGVLSIAKHIILHAGLPDHVTWSDLAGGEDDGQ